MIQNTQADLNVQKYRIPPPMEQIEAFIKEFGQSMYRFERYFGIHCNHLANVRCGSCNLAKAYWHIFYERIIPQYGVGIEKREYQPRPPKFQKSRIPKRRPSKIDRHNRLSNIQ